MRDKGSKIAMVKLVKSNDVITIFNDLIKKSGAIITTEDVSIPNAQISSKEVTLSTFLRQNFDPKKADAITKWWIEHGTATPKWDLISTCTIDKERGILLVEAKAHKGELKKDKKSKPTSENSKINHKKIGKAIAEVNTKLEKEISGICLSTENCYQFSNRVAHAWWLANHGIPVVLLYLGFLNVNDLNDDNEKYKYKLFTSPEDWRTCFEEHTKLVGANKLINKTIDCGRSSFITICNSY